MGDLTLDNQYRQFDRHRSEYLSFLQPITKYLVYQPICYNPYPLALDASTSEELISLSVALMNAVEAIANAYMVDQTIQHLMPLPERFVKILQIAQGIDFKHGTMRPDLLFGRNGELKLCEINARFPLNGMTISQYLSEAAFQANYLSAQKYQPIEPLSGILTQILNRFQTDKPLALIAKQEVGGESHFFMDQFRANGGRIILATPDRLAMKQGRVVIEKTQVEQFILEIDREELCLFDQQVLQAIIHHSNYINDVRNLILVHDKRILSVLGNTDIMRNYVNETELALLTQHIPETVDLENETVFQRVLREKKHWVIKKKSGGRGVGLLIGRLCSEELWRSTLLSRRNDYMAQAYVSPAQFPVLHDNGNVLSQTLMHVVGSLPCFDGQCFGAGMFRASEEVDINIGKGQGESIFLGSVIGTGMSETKPVVFQTSCL